MNENVRIRINSLRPLLKDPSPDVRKAAAEAIEKLEATGSVDEVLATLKTGSMGARIGAIHALGEIGGEKVLPALVYCARRPEVDIRAAAVTVLGKLARPETLTILVGLLDDETPAVQCRAIAALRNFPVIPDILTKLRSFLSANDGALEAEAALTLAEFKDQYSLSHIQDLLTSPHASTRQAAATAIGRMPLQ